MSIFRQNFIILQGVNNRVVVGDYLLAVENEENDNERANLRQVTAVNVDKTGGTTTISWQDPKGVSSFASKKVRVYALRVTAAPFGSTAPRWDTLSPTLTTVDHQTPDAPLSRQLG